MSVSGTPEQELIAKAWRAATLLAVAVVVFGGGYAAGYVQYGDAVELRAKVAQAHDRIVDLENEREGWNYRYTRPMKISRDLEVCEKALKVCRRDGAKSP